MKKILIFTSKTGGGHVSLAEALRDCLQGEFAVEILDPQPGIIHWHYRMVSRHALWLWAAEFKLSDTPQQALASHRLFTRLFARNIAGVLKQVQPDLVMSTYPFLTYEVVSAMQRSGQRVPFAMLFADPNGVHVSWLTERRADAAFAPTQETYDQAAKAGFSSERLHLTGWPVREQFYRQPETVRQEVCQRLGLDAQRFTLFLQGGGEGAARFVQTVENLLAVEGIQIILAAGTNQAIAGQFEGVEGVRALPFTQEIAPYMAAADVVVGKAGPNMLFETVILGRPFIATAYIPGQEKANLEFIMRHRLGWVELEAEGQVRLVSALARDRVMLTAVLESVNHYREWNTAAVETILPLTRRLLEKGTA